MTKGKKSAVKRLSFPEEEKNHHWLSQLLESYAVVDEGVARAIGQKSGKEGKKLACRQGCDVCCRQRDIPVYPHELMGIYWYCVEKIRQPTREVLKHRLAGHGREDACPFLMDGSCVVHPFRPAGCRQFNVFDRACEEGEDPFHSRRDDVLTPLREYTHRAFSLVLSLYDLTDEEKRNAGTVEKIIQTQVINIRSYDWKKLAARMTQHDSR